MMKIYRIPFFVLLLGSFALLGQPRATASNEAPAGLQVRDAWVRWMPSDLPAAGYFTLVNDSDEDRFLVGASSADYRMVHLHESFTTESGMSRMRSVEKVLISAHGETHVRPGGYHLMLMKARHAISPGDTVTVILTFADGQTLTVKMPVKPAGHTE